jgi:hypothetical protein
MRLTIALVVCGLALSARDAVAQRPSLTRRSMEGPRLGATYITGSRARETLRAHGLGSIMSQFGWHFEQQVSPTGGNGPVFVIEEVLLVGAVEQQKLVPSFTVLFGMRMPSGIEFGLGPNLSAVGTALAVGVGKNLRYGDVSLPINLAVVGSPGALRTTVLVGYAIQSSN